MNLWTRHLLSITLLMCVALANAWAGEDMQKYLSDTEKLVRTKKYKEALERFQWFHENALKHEPSMYGVRLSFALSSWHQLGQKYPPAMLALEQTRDRAVEQLLAGNGNRELFHDASSINQTLDEDKTVDLFAKLDEKYPSLSRQCWSIVREEVIDAERYDLAKKYFRSLPMEFDCARQSYVEDVRRNPKKTWISGITKSFGERRFEKRCLQIIKVGIALNDIEAARDIQRKALIILDSDKIRNALPPEDATEKAGEK